MKPTLRTTHHRSVAGCAPPPQLTNTNEPGPPLRSECFFLSVTFVVLFFHCDHLVVLCVLHSAFFHNGAHLQVIRFLPRGSLWVSVSDGGASNLRCGRCDRW